MRLMTKFSLVSIAALAVVIAILAGVGMQVMDRVVTQDFLRFMRLELANAVAAHGESLATVTPSDRPARIGALLRVHEGVSGARFFAYDLGGRGPTFRENGEPGFDAAAITAMIATGEGEGWYPAADQRMLARFTVLPKAGLLLGIRVPEEQVYAWHGRYLRAVGAASLVLVLVGSAVALVFARRLSGRLARTAAALDAIRDGEYGIKLPDAGGDDELSAIQARINDMADGFARRSREREAATRWLEENEKRFRDFAESMSDALWETDADLRYTWFVNPGRDFGNVTGGTGPIGQKRGEYFEKYISSSTDWRSHLYDMENRRPFRDFYFSGVYADGTVFHRVSGGTPIFDANGGFRGFRGTTTDITDRVEAEKRLQNLVANVPGVVYQRLVHPDGRIEYSYLSDGLDGATDGGGAPESAPVDSLESVHPDDRDMFRRAVIEGARSGRPSTLEYRRIGPDGRVSWIRSSASAASGRADGVLVQDGISFDITDLRETEEDLRRAQERLLDFTRSGYDTLWETDAEHRITWLSDPVTARGRYLRKDSMIGLRRWEFPGADPADDAVWKHHIDDLENRRPFRDFEFETRAPDGRPVFRRLSGRPVFDEHGNFTGYRGVSTDITERVESERTARASQQRLIDAIQASDQGVALFDADDVLVFVNDACLDMQSHFADLFVIGRTFEEIILEAGRSRRLPGIAKEEIDDWIRRRIDYHKDPKGPFGTVRMNDRQVEIREERLPDGGSMIYLTDVTAQTETKEALQKSEERFRAFAESISDWLWETDTEHRLTWLSDTVVLHSQLRLEDIVGNTRWELFGIDPEKDETWRAHVADMNAHRRIRDFRYSRLDETGRTVHRSVNAVPTFDAEGRFLGYRGSVTDITDRVEAEQRYRELIESAPMPITVDDGEKFVFVNQAFCELYRADGPEAVIGRPVTDMVHPDEMDTFLDRLTRISRHRRPLPIAQLKRRRFDGEAITVLGRGVPIRWEGKPATLGIQVDISDRIAAEEALQDSEERFRNLVEGSRQGVLLHVDFKPVFANAALAEMFGYESSDEILALPSVLDLVAPGDREMWRQNRDARLNGLNAPESYEFNGLKKDGTPIWVHINVRVVGWEGRTALQGTMIDITERRQAEEAIRESEERFRLLTTTSPVGVFVTDAAGNCEYVNEAYEAMSGLSAEEAVGQGWMNALDPADRDRVFDEWHEATRFGRQFRTEFRFRRKDGSTVWAIAQATGQRDMLGRIVRYIGAVTDVTGRKRAEEALRDSETRFRTLTSLSPVGVFLTNRRGDIEYINEALSTMLGMPPEEAIAGTWMDGIHPEDRDEVRRAWAEAFARQDEIEIEIRMGDGVERDIRWALVQASPLRSPEGTNSGYVGAVTDITDRRNAEAQLRQVHKMDAVGQLTGGIAHDFNNLLAIVQGNLELLRERAPDEPRLVKLIEAAHGAARRGATLNQRLLAFARRQPLRPEKCDINVIVHDMAGLFERTIGENIQLKTRFAKCLWTANIDPNGLETAVLNLAINARDAMPDGGSLTISTSNARYTESHPGPAPEVRTGDYVVLRVMDSGTGMDTDTLAQAFDPFFTTKGTGKGSGLGLSMVYGFARQSGGHVIIESVLGQGTSISLFFPRHADGDAASYERAAETRAPAGAGECILVVEDDEDVRDMAIGMFDSLNYKTLEAASAEEALRILENGTAIDLLFTDVMLGNGDNGPELARKARQRFPGLRVLFTSGYAKTEFESGQPIETGALISKPYQRNDLARAVRSALQTGRA